MVQHCGEETSWAIDNDGVSSQEGRAVCILILHDTSLFLQTKMSVQQNLFRWEGAKVRARFRQSPSWRHKDVVHSVHEVFS